MLTTDLVERVLTTIPGRTIGVLGDLFLDRYLDIDPGLNEPSVETGLTAYQVVKVRSYPGAAGTVINNLAALGVGRIYPIACIGDDGEGYELRQALRTLSAVEQGGIIQSEARRTPTYTKPMLGKDELNRLDIKNRTPTPDGIQSRIIELLDAAWPQLDALLVLDQVSEEDCGVVTARVREHVARLAERDSDKFVMADSRERIYQFRNVCVKPNGNELKSSRELSSQEPTGGGAVYDDADLKILPPGPLVFATNGEQGIRLFDTRKGEPVLTSVPAYPVAGPIDICGAGDSCSAGIASAMVSGLTHEQAAAFGNLVASITIQQIGVTGTAPPEKVRARWREVG
ncbi:Bifunctional protein HldE [Gemmata obscuriglobus]|uniref:Carbohydrate kinase n=1 Tax=Gemmata obscuriglobus TaxID=114 RepID=A0A2Z3H4N5_9BACT|nr:PfkB family carbohydrate kinase [Gemmata obscuriglobus]AWM40718.1 carbohydrate kinase [Gemmata obscuriglobus]QEG26011.1 Bifunctional protein HldE [Gemmata obscuriglobus]VTS00314.1 domain protein : PfkB domain protein OS=Treponema azotonutricium (strain ATCC BAA-888 / DSM 13862 / ZAS-9) GN=TREAZ_1017 PE=4 SV=1: PfkB [Gemmata obscuriglobus UQM 2246]